MRVMKDSGIAWIDKIPLGWTIKRLKWIVKFEKGLPITKDDLIKHGVPVVSYGQIHSKANNGTHLRDDLIRYVSEEYLESNPLSLGKKGDIFFADTSEDYAGIGNAVLIDVDSPVFAGYHTVIVRPDDQVYSRYLAYLFLTDAWRSQLCSRASGIKVFSITQGLLKKTTVILPPAEKAIEMTAFLDRKCSQIDAIIARQQEVIEKLKAYKLSVITEAVTKGLNPHAPMKDSGVEWIGKVPEQWRMIRLKFLMSDIIDCPHETPAYSDDGEYLVIRTADQDLGKLRADQDMYRLNRNEYQNRIRRMALNKNDIVYGREGERWGLACLVPESNKYCLGQRMLQFRCKNELLLPHFAVWALNSKYIYLQGSVDTIGSTSPHVNISTVQNFLMPVPQICEQQEITEYIDKKMLQLDKDLLHRNTLIRKLIGYKKSLVYEVVTGKKEVI